MSDMIKTAQKDAATVQADATRAADAALAQASKFAGQATAGIEVAQTDARGWLRRNVWGLLGAVIVLALIAFWVLVR